MLKKDAIELAMSEKASSVVFPLSKDGKLHFCVDYRKDNAKTVRDTYPLSRREECIDSLGAAIIFFKLGSNTGYWQIEIPEMDRERATFFSQHGLF